ncbi:MAG: dihydroorotate dehydrogenase electron transfer subunit [Candidatus Omnitrophota bacterium]
MKLEIIRNVFLKDRYLLLELSAPRSFSRAVPGQFLHIRIEDSSDPLLRRPLSIHDLESRKRGKSSGEKTIVKILYEIAGKGTALLAEKRPLSQVDVLGPLGRGFDIKKARAANVIYLLAGGMGVAPLYFLAKRLSREKKKIEVLIGGRNKDHIMREREFRDLGCEVHVATEDGSLGLKGRVTALLLERLKAARPQGRRAICACGPKPMLAAVAEISRQKSIPAQVSLEEFMGCGVGACLGCVIRTTFGYKRICHDGPVFDAEEVIWTE